MTTVIRIVLTVALLVMVYGETGPWTTALLTLVAAANEAQNYLIRKLAGRAGMRVA